VAGQVAERLLEPLPLVVELLQPVLDECACLVEHARIVCHLEISFWIGNESQPFPHFFRNGQ
jgi:hypothetical protein